MEAGPSSAQATLAHYWDDVADTLAGDQNSAVQPPAVEPTSSMVNSVLIGVATVVTFFWLGHWLSAWRRARREKAFNLELRRRHGIPDSDTRPFNVAYQAASIAARDSVRKSQSIQPENPQLIGDTAPSTSNIKEGFRQGRSRPPIPHFPGQPPVRVPSGSFNFGQTQPVYPSTSFDSSRALSQLPNAAAAGSWGPRYSADNYRATSVPTVPTVSTRSAFAVAAASGSLRSNNSFAQITGDRRSSANRPATTSRATANVSQARSRKRLYLTADEEAEEQQMGVPTDKRSRTAGWGSEAMIDGDNEPTWAQSHPIEANPVADSYAPQIGKSKGKRPADDDEGDLRADGKRRHTKSSKQRPKQSDVQEKRGTKRERKEVDTASVLNDVMPVHKRGRAGDVDNDLSIVKEEELDEEDDPTVSRNPLCGGRRIGQKWTSNGQEYMVGPNGDRLRLVNVKESRKKYYMPADSKHADNFHTVEVFVEKWLTEEQYAKAKADGLLAWQENENLPNIKQESPERVPLENKDNQTEERPRAISTTAITLSRARAANTIWNTPGQSPLQANSPHTNPFNTPPSATTPQSPGPRRVRYSIGTVPPAALNASRMISTWEKQEREANALKILRERRAAEAAKASPAPSATPAPVVPTLTLPTSITAPAITVTAPSPASSISMPKVSPPAESANKPAESKAPTFSFAPSAPKPAEPAPTAPASAPAPAAAPANPFSFAAPKKEVAKPLFSATPAATTTTPSTSLFPQAAPSTSTTPAFGANTSTVTTAPPVAPSPFGATPAAPAPAPTPVAAPSPSPFGALAPAPAPKPSPFAFSTPSTASQPAAPAATNSLGSAPSGTSLFGATPAAPAAQAAPSPFGATPAAPSPAATKPMGGFSFNPTSTTPAASSTTAPTGSTLFGGQTTKPASTGFSFNTGNTTANATSEAKPAGTGFSFSTAPQTTTPASTGFGNTAAPKPNPFATTATTATASSGFGANSGASSSPFAFGGPKTTASAATTSGFGTQPAASGSSTFKFGETNGAAPAAPTTSGSGFQFGASKPTVTIPASTPFGAPSTTTPTTATNGGFTFGAGTAANANNGVAASPATPSKPLFTLGAAASPVMGTRQISTSKRVQRAMSKPPQ